MQRRSDPDASSFLTLLNAAHRTYADAIRRALADAGFGDMPLTGYRIAIFLRSGGLGIQELAGRVSISKQATSRLVEVLVSRGYCERVSDPSDRRRASVVLTERGQSAAGEIRRAVRRLNDAVSTHVDAGEIATTRAVLAVVTAVGRARVGARR